MHDNAPPPPLVSPAWIGAFSALKRRGRGGREEAGRKREGRGRGCICPAWLCLGWW